MTDLVIYLKAMPPSSVKWPAGTKAVGLDPRPQFSCGGADALCSTAFSQLYSSLKDSSGRALPALLKRLGVTDLGKLVFVSFSAGHGFMNPWLMNDSDRAATTGVVLMDSTFGGGKGGYVAAAKDAVAGKGTLVSVTSNKGSTDALNDGDYAFREFVLKPAGLLSMPSASAVPPMPQPKDGVFKSGNLWYYRYLDSEVHHWDLGKLMTPVTQAHVLPILSGSGVSSGASGNNSTLVTLGVIAAVAGGAYALSRGRRPKVRDNPPRRARDNRRRRGVG